MNQLLAIPSAGGSRTAGAGPRRVGSAVALVLLFLGSTVTAQDFTSVDPDSALAAALGRLPGAPLRLDQAVARALTHSPEVLEARAALRAAEGELRRESGAFDPELFADVTATHVETPSSSPFARPDVVENDETASSAGARITLPLGTEIEARVTTRRIDTNSEFAAVDPEYRADGAIELRQPLLQGLGAGTWSDKRAAAQQREAARAGYHDARRRVRAEVETLYWQLYATERDVAVQQLIVEQAEALLEQARLRASAGLVGPNEVANARVFLAEQNLAVLDREEELASVSDQLASRMGERPSTGDRFRSAESPPEEYPVPDVERALSQTYARHPSLLAEERALAASRARVSGARWNRLPALDLIGSLGGNGLAGRSREVVFGGDPIRLDVDGGTADALGDVFERRYGTWAVGVELSVPFTFRQERGEHDRLRAEVERQQQRVEAQRRELEERVRAAHRELTHSGRRLVVAREGVDASLEQVRIGLIEYENGRTTAFELVRLGADLAGAQRRLSAALVRAASAAAEMRYLTGGEEATAEETRP